MSEESRRIQFNALMERAVRNRDEIRLLLSMADYWNERVRKPDEKPIDIDYDGELKRCLDWLDKFIARGVQ